MGRWRAVAALVLRNQIVNSSKPSSQCVLKHPTLWSHRRREASRLLDFRHFSAFPSPISIYNNDSDSGSSDVYQSYDFGTQEEEDRGKIPIKAYFLSTSIDLKGMQADNLCNVVPPTSRSTNSIALKFSDSSSGIPSLDERESVSSCRFMVVFQYGSAVLFNVDDSDVESYLDIVRRHASGLLTEMRKDDYAVKEKPLLTEEMRGGPDYIVLKTLDTDSIRIIGSVLGQSIALDYFVSQVDKLVEEFAGINRAMEKTGTFTMHRKKLFQLVGKANSNLADVILRVGLFDRSEIAWREARYAQIYEYLREEYEVTQRFGNLDFKLKFVEHNIHFLQEVMQNRRSDLLEWCIIFLLTLENALSIYEIVRESL
uniref:Sporulation protein RMD1 n=1 Tax=Noccaea caerulescens TaxID=107243 RepID=A0A1J3INS8_NOCCA